MLRCLRTDFSDNRLERLTIYQSYEYRGARFGGEKTELSSGLSLVRSAEDDLHITGSRRLDPHWIDSNLPGQWKQACEQSHGKKCSEYWNTSQFHSTRPQLLIDTEDQCLVDMDPGLSYVALSYVWERADSLKTLLWNLSELRKPGALATQPEAVGVTPTIRNAMHIIKLLGERYLWADALCIIQDDEGFKHAEIQNMHAIYANASLTIIAASSSSCGIAGISGVTEARRLYQTIHDFGEREIAEISDELDVPGSTSVPSRWASRGWTFQENLFSPRKLIFSKDTIRWECEKATWIEDQATLNEEESTATDPEAKVFLHKIPDVRRLVSLLNSYAARILTYEEDALFACAGMFSALRSSFSDGFISGLPTAFFNSALLWVHEGAATRREAKTAKASHICLPSWSWAGWKGKFSHRSWHPGTDYVKHSSRMKQEQSPSFQSRIQWYSHKSPDSIPKAILCSWLRNRDAYTDYNRIPPPCGWKRIEVASDYQTWNYNGPKTLSGEVPKWCYTHESEPEAECWYPVPTEKVAEDTPADILAPFISCRTRRGHAICGSIERCKVFAENLVDVRFCSLLGENGEWIGALELHEDLTSYDSTNRKSHRLIGTRFELVEIGEGDCANGRAMGFPSIPEYGLKARPKTGSFYQFYYVLWIEWESEIAYRRGLGRVMKRAWEAQDLEDIDLMMG